MLNTKLDLLVDIDLDLDLDLNLDLDLDLDLDLVTMGPLCLMKVTCKRKLIRILGFFLDFFPQLNSTTRS